MNFLIAPSNNGWVATRNNITRGELSDLVLGSDVVFADLDDCILPSPAKRLAYERLKDIKSYFDFDLILWGLESGLDLFTDGKSAESGCWKSYTELFLNSEKKRKNAKQKVEELLEKGKLKEYSGAAEFFRLVLEGKTSFLLTRNIPEITEIFKEIYGFNIALSQAWNKVTLVNTFSVISKPKKYLIIGDSEEDQALVESFVNYERQGIIERVTSIYVAESSDKKHLNKNFTINIGRDYRGLVEILRE